MASSSEQTPHPSLKQYFVPFVVSGTIWTFSEGTIPKLLSSVWSFGSGRDTDKDIPIRAQYIFGWLMLKEVKSPRD